MEKLLLNSFSTAWDRKQKALSFRTRETGRSYTTQIVCIKSPAMLEMTMFNNYFLAAGFAGAVLAGATFAGAAFATGLAGTAAGLATGFAGVVTAGFATA